LFDAGAQLNLNGRTVDIKRTPGQLFETHPVAVNWVVPFYPPIPALGVIHCVTYVSR